MESKKIKNTFNTKKILIGFFSNLSNKRKFQLGIVFITMLFSAFAEAISLASIIPFLTLISDPESLLKIPFIKEISLYLNINEIEQLKLFVVVFFVIAIITSGALRIFNLWINGRVAALIGSELSCKAFMKNIYQPYSIQINRNSSTLISTSTQELRFVIQCINLTLIGLTNLFICFGIVGTLILVDKSLAIFAFSACTLIYVLIALLVNKKLYINSKKTNEAYKSQVKIIQEGFGGIRDLILYGSQSLYIDLYSKVDKPMRIYQAQSNFFSAFPRYALESAILVILALFAYSLNSDKSFNNNLVPSLGVLALGAQRLLPAIQLVYANWANVKSNIFNLANVLNQINQSIPDDQIVKTKHFKFKEKIELEDISFKYEEKYIFKNINLSIKKGQIIGVTGKTGSGKSTLVDLIMGLLIPTDGRLLIDNKCLNDKKNYKLISSWRKSIAHVPQNIFLIDSSFIENITFGTYVKEIDIARVKKSAKAAQIHDFILSTKYGYETKVGERGIKLSGGQKQRIGIARALYRNPELLVLDEATSALDFITEKNVLRSIERICKNTTIIMIAHRVSTLKNCDKNIVISNGYIHRNLSIENLQ